MLSSDSNIRWRFLLLGAIVLAAIVHGSLYPYAFQSHGGATAAAKALLASWKTPPTGFADAVANICLYMPLGFAGVLALQYRQRLAAVTLFGLLLCTAIEIGQFFDAGRVTNMSDVYLNTAGTFLGGLAAAEFSPRLSTARFPSRAGVVPAALLITLLGYRLYPYVPTIDVRKYWHAVKDVLLCPNFSAWDIFRYLALWLTTFFLLQAVLRRNWWFTIFCFAGCVLAAKIVIAGQTLSASELAGAALALCVWFAALERSRFCATALFVLLGTMIVLFRLQPFEFRAAVLSPFGWVPFRSVVQGAFQPNLLASGEKIFLYGSLIWIGARAGLSSWISTLIAALLLLVTSLAETHIPGRSAEVTDCVIALLVGAGIAALDHAAASRFTPEKFKHHAMECKQS